MKDILIISILATVTASAPAAMPASRHVYDATDYGAKPDGKTLCTAAIQKAIDECSAQGGGTVRLSGGRFLSGTVFMKSKVTLEIAEGSTLLGSKDLKDYPLTRPAYRSYTDNYTERSVPARCPDFPRLFLRRRCFCCGRGVAQQDPGQRGGLFPGFEKTALVCGGRLVRGLQHFDRALHRPHPMRQTTIIP